MLKALRENKITAALLALGFICALLLCGARVAAEAKNNEVCFIMTAADMALIDGGLPLVREFDGGNTLDGKTLLIEDDAQFSYVPKASLVLGGDMARCLYLFPQFAARYNYLGFDGAKELENLIYRAVTERNIRVVWLTPFTDSLTGARITDAEEYNSVISALTTRLARHGLSVGGGFSAIAEREPSRLLLSGAMLGVFAACCLLLCALCKPIKWLALPGAVICPAAAWLLPSLAVPIFAFAAAAVFPALAMWHATDALSALRARPLSRELGAYASLLAVSAAIALVGGLFVGALQSSSDYMLAVLNFRGVKLSQILPLIFTVYLVLRFLCPPRELLSAGKLAVLLCAALLLCAGGYYILRSGNSSVGIFEQRCRNLLENVLLARPRTKEFLIAWPCLALAAIALAHDRRRYCWPFAILSSVGFSSIVNTFCHSRSPLWLSLTRSLTGVLIGGAVGLVLIALTHRARPRG
ncbi:MAG: DUF5693 family protein [Oscillospiraceae bacterium]